MFRDPALLERRNHGLRLAFAVALGLVFEILRGALVPPLAAAIALQLLALPGPRPTTKMVVGLFVVVTGASLFAYGVSVLTADQILPYALGVGLIYLWGFALAAQPKTAAVGTMTLTMGIVVTTLAAVSTDLAAVLVVELLLSVAFGIALVFLAHAVFPQRTPIAGASAEAGVPVGGSARAMVAALIILPLHLALSADGVAAMVVLLTVATMLRQVRVEQAARYATNSAVGNLLGGLLAAAAVRVVSLHDAIPVLATVVVAAALLIAWSIERVPTFAHVLLPGFVAFTVLFGLAFMPASLSADVEVLKRLVQIVAAGLYALGAVSLFMPFAHRSRPSAGNSVA